MNTMQNPELKAEFDKAVAEFQKHAAADSARLMVRETCARLRTELPALLGELETLPHSPCLSRYCAADDALDEKTVRIARAIRALRQLSDDLPDLEEHWANEQDSIPETIIETSPTQKLVVGQEPADPEIKSLEGLNIETVLSLVDAGKITAARALELERMTKRPRPSLIAHLEEDAKHEATYQADHEKYIQ